MNPPSRTYSVRLPVCVFLIKHATSGEYALFDLGLWKVCSPNPTSDRTRFPSLVLVLTSVDGQDWSETIAPEKREAYEVYEANVEEDLDSVLEKQGVKLEDIKVIVISRTFLFASALHTFSRDEPRHHSDEAGTAPQTTTLTTAARSASLPSQTRASSSDPTRARKSTASSRTAT